MHFSPIHPALIFQALKTVFPDGNRLVKFFKIPITKAKGHPMVLFDMNRDGYEFGNEDPDHVFDLLSVDSYCELEVVPEPWRRRRR